MGNLRAHASSLGVVTPCYQTLRCHNSLAKPVLGVITKLFSVASSALQCANVTKRPILQEAAEC